MTVGDIALSAEERRVDSELRREQNLARMKKRREKKKEMEMSGKKKN